VFHKRNLPFISNIFPDCVKGARKHRYSNFFNISSYLVKIVTPQEGILLNSLEESSIAFIKKAKEIHCKNLNYRKNIPDKYRCKNLPHNITISHDKNPTP
jgi:hypothetical protein